MYSCCGIGPSSLRGESVFSTVDGDGDEAVRNVPLRRSSHQPSTPIHFRISSILAAIQRPPPEVLFCARG